MGLELPLRATRAVGGSLLAVGVLALAGCSAQDTAQIKRLALPRPATEQAPAIYDLWMWGWLAAMVTGVIVWGLIGWAAVHYRRRSDDDVPVQIRYHLPLEIFYTILPVVMVVVLFFYTVKAQDEVLAEPKNPDHVVNVIGQQWSWTFAYQGEDAVEGKNVYTSGTGSDTPTLWLPVDETVRFNLSSPDVIHSFWVPVFLFKMDVIPGAHNHFAVTPNRTGTFVGKCAELCGAYHSRMLFNVKVVSRDRFDQHLEHLEKTGFVGNPSGASDAETAAGLNSPGGESGGSQ